MMGSVGGGGLWICWFSLGKVDLVVIFEGSGQFRCEIFSLGGAGEGASVMMIALHHVLALREGV